MVFIQYHEYELMDLDGTSYMEVFLYASNFEEVGRAYFFGGCLFVHLFVCQLVTLFYAPNIWRMVERAYSVTTVCLSLRIQC